MLENNGLELYETACINKLVVLHIQKDYWPKDYWETMYKLSQFVLKTKSI